jgi:hypothetical protein
MREYYVMCVKETNFKKSFQNNLSALLYRFFLAPSFGLARAGTYLYPTNAPPFHSNQKAKHLSN